MTTDERNAVIEECIRTILAARDEWIAEGHCSPQERDAIETTAGAACYRLMRLKRETWQIDRDAEGLPTRVRIGSGR
jgi:hypothetical protein